MCAPTPESSGSMTRTLAPLVMADCAMLNCVASRPSAFSMVKSAVDIPAAVKACFRYGASNSTYRVEDVVSGRITVTLPLPAEVRPLEPRHRGERVVQVVDGDRGVRRARRRRRPWTRRRGGSRAAAAWWSCCSQQRRAARPPRRPRSVRLVLIRNTTVYLAHSLRHAAGGHVREQIRITQTQLTGLLRGNARTARRNVRVNTFVMFVKKALIATGSLKSSRYSSRSFCDVTVSLALISQARAIRSRYDTSSSHSSSPSFAGDPVAGARLGEDQRRAARRLELGPQPPDVHPDVLGLRLVPAAPDPAQQVGAGQQLAPVAAPARAAARTRSA